MNKRCFVDHEGDVRLLRDLKKDSYRVTKRQTYIEIALLDEDSSELDAFVLHKDRDSAERAMKSIF